MSKYLLAASIGPVQEFISSARRLQDLWFGSWLLSELSKASALAMANACGDPDLALVFPGVKAADLTPNSKENAANKLLLIVPDGKNATDIAKEGEAAMKLRLIELSKSVFQNVEDAGGSFNTDMAFKQVEDLMEFQWIVVPLGESYGLARSEAERLLAAVKNTKAWGQPTWGSFQRKSSLDGVRESVLPESDFDDYRNADVTNKALLADDLYKKFRVRPTERLCGVGLLKRWGQEVEGGDSKPKFHSSGHVAAQHALSAPGFSQKLAEWSKNNLSKAGMKRCQTSEGHVDGGILFDEIMDDILPDGLQRKEAIESLAELKKSCGLPDAPTPYYAILHADGDSMGKVLDAGAQLGAEQHRKISQALDRFSKGVESIVKRHLGTKVYSGGDDVLAMLPLHTALACARELAEDYSTKMQQFKTHNDKSSTLSVGLAIVHFQDDLADALNLARRAEKAAKDAGRDALGILLSKRGGGELIVAQQWKTNLDKFILALANAHVAKTIGSKLPYELETLKPLLQGQKPESELVKFARMEAVRMLGRRRQEGGSVKLQEAEVNLIKDKLSSIQSTQDIDALIASLRIAQELSKALKIVNQEDSK